VQAVRSAFTIAASYLAFGILWIFWSDKVLHRMITDPAMLQAWQTRKGLAFVIASTILLGLLLWREAVRLSRLDDDWRSVVSRAREGFWMIGADGRVEAVNESLTRMLGAQRKDVVGHRPEDFVTREHRDRIRDVLGAAMREQVDASRPSCEIELQCSDGTAIPILLHVTGLNTRRGRVRGCYAFITDLSEVRAYERELELTREGLDNTFDAFFRISPVGEILAANVTACSRLGYHRDELIGRNVADVDPKFPASARQAHWEDLKARGSMFFETQHQRKDGTRFPVEVGQTYFRYQGAEYDLAVARDISQRKTAEAAGERYKRALRALSRGNAALVHAQDERSLFDEVCRALTESHDYPQACVYLRSDNPDDRPRVAACITAPVPDVDADGENQPDEHDARVSGDRLVELVRRALDSGQMEVGQVPARPGLSLMALPIGSRGELIGALGVLSDAPGAFSVEERGLLEELAGDIGYGVHALRVRAERDRQVEQLRLAGTVFENTPEGILITDADIRIQAVNPAFTRITGYTEDEALGNTPASLLKSGVQGEDFYQELWNALNEEGRWQGEIYNRRRNGEIYPEWLTISEVRDDAGNLTNYVAVFSDISESRELENKLADLTYRDPLTRLPNRTLFREHVEHALAGHQSDGRSAVVMVDLRGFRALNETLGSDGGDRVLCTIGERLSAALSGGETLARPGSDEFWFLIDQVSRSRTVRHRVSRLLEIIDQAIEIGGQSVTLEARAGVAVAPQDGSDAETILSAASTALHRAQVEEESIRFFEPDMQEQSRRRLRLEEGLKGAVGRDEIEVWYQPQVELATGRVVAVEALARWRDPDLGMVPPGDFIPIAEESGLIRRLGRHVLTVAARQAARWQAEGVPIRHVAVNVSALQLQQPDWSETVRSILEHAGCENSWIELEITEESVLGDIERTVEVLEKLKGKGVRTAIDDFGTGYSSLAYLKRLPLDLLKIDKTFIDGLPESEHDRSIVRAILAVANALGLAVVAEGVETREQADWLRDQGVSLAQGFLFGRPDLPERLVFDVTPDDGERTGSESGARDE